jgi:hypothetical protein
MYRTVAAALLVLSSFCVAAADWQVVADTKLGQLKLDKASVVREGKYTAALLVYEFKDLQSLLAPANTVFNNRQDDVLVDCSNPSLGIRASRFFEDGKLVSTHSLTPANVRFNAPAPDTMALKVVESICAVAPNIKP